MSGQDPRDAIDNAATTSPQLPAVIDSAMPAILRAEIDGQIATARQYPRNVHNAIRNITSLATLDEETAAESLYALVRKKKQNNRSAATAAEQENKAIEGPSIRLAEIAAQCWGNCRIEAHVVTVNRKEMYVEAVGTFHDLETNMASTATVRRNISTAGGYLFSADMITVTGNAACAIAKRNAILAGIPRGVYRPAYQAARGVVAGTVATLSVNREKAIKAFAAYGVTPSQIFEVLDLEGEGDVKLDHIATLRAMFMSIKNGEATVEEMFAKEKPSIAPDHNPLLKDAGLSSGGAGNDTTNTEAQRTAQGNAPAHASSERSQASDQEPETSGSGTSAADASPSSKPDLLSTDTPPVDSKGEAAPYGQTDGAGGQEPGTPPAPDRLRSYAKALAGITDGGPPKLVKMSTQWTGKYGIFEGADESKRVLIYNAHLGRLTGTMTPDGCKAEVERIIGP